MVPMAEPHSVDAPASGYLVVRASGAAAARAAILGGPARSGGPDRIQLLLRCPIPRAVAESGAELKFADATLHLRPSEPGGVVLLTVAAAKLSISFAELRPLMFRPVEVAAPLRSLVAGAVAHVLAAGPRLDPHGLAHHLLGLAELVLRSALRVELDRVDALAARRREALEYMRAHLAEQSLSADKIAEALYISRRRLYQLFDDGQGVSERLKGLRIERAKAVLADPAKAGRGIAEVARDCGFTSAPHFSRTFRRATGRTPREYREQALRG
jgi:AraC-like DNA-binding protein